MLEFVLITRDKDSTNSRNHRLIHSIWQQGKHGILYIKLVVSTHTVGEYCTYRVSQKCGALYTAFELGVVGQTNLEIVSTKILPTFFYHDKGSRALWKAQTVLPWTFSHANMNLVGHHWTRQTVTNILTPQLGFCVRRLQNGGILMFYNLFNSIVGILLKYNVNSHTSLIYYYLYSVSSIFLRTYY